jgi:hypothetical protein
MWFECWVKARVPIIIGTVPVRPRPPPLHLPPAPILILHQNQNQSIRIRRITAPSLVRSSRSPAVGDGLPSYAAIATPFSLDLDPHSRKPDTSRSISNQDRDVGAYSEMDAVVLKSRFLSSSTTGLRGGNGAL